MGVGTSTRRRLPVRSAIGLLVAGVVALGLYVGYQRIVPLLRSSGCEASDDGQVVSLNPGQAGIAATIAGVAQRDSLPAEAVTVAYATALQESKLRNLPFGDRDSVGVFQQRPSEGWGTPRQLEDPVYATSKFFGALQQVPGYQQMPVYQAAQAVQRSADGQAYQAFQPMAAHMASAFTGLRPHAVWCWYPRNIHGTLNTQAVSQELSRTFGQVASRPSGTAAGDGDGGAQGDPAMSVAVPSTGAGWAVASWLVSHATQYQVRTVEYGGYQWSAANGSRGWVRSVSTATPGSVQLG